MINAGQKSQNAMRGSQLPAQSLNNVVPSEATR